jgi:hypothetical protein
MNKTSRDLLSFETTSKKDKMISPFKLQEKKKIQLNKTMSKVTLINF